MLDPSTPLCTVTRFVGQGAFGEVYEVVWAGVGRERGATLAMKTVRLADLDMDKQDEYRVLLLEEILTVKYIDTYFASFRIDCNVGNAASLDSS